MGYNTAAIILNDGLGQIRKDLEIGEAIYQATLGTESRRVGTSDIRAGNHLNAMAVLSPRHADETQVILIHGNCIRRAASFYSSIPYHHGDGDERLLIGNDSDLLGVELLKALAHHLGYSTRKIR